MDSVSFSDREREEIAATAGPAPEPIRLRGPTSAETVRPTSPAPAPAPAKAEPVRAKRKKGKLILAAVLLAGVAGGGNYGWHWWTVGRFEESTDNAFLQADKVTVAPKVGGFVASVLVGDNQAVKAGDVLATIDDRDYTVAIAEAEAELDKDQAQLDGFKAAVIQQLAQVETSKADVANAEAALTFAQQEAKRYQDLLNSGAGTSQRAQQTASDLLQRQASLTKARASLDAAEKQVTTYQSLAKGADATIAGARAKLDKAKLDLSYTVIRAPVDGVVGDRSVRTGQLVQAGTALLTVVPMGRDIYLVANFKETQVGDMAPGLPVTFTVDAFGGHTFHGTVDSFSPGTGAQFALLPPENATGNFTKVVQRVPVKIRLADDEPLLSRLRPGLSVEATVDLRNDAAGRPASRTLVGLADTPRSP